MYYLKPKSTARNLKGKGKSYLWTKKTNTDKIDEGEGSTQVEGIEEMNLPLTKSSSKKKKLWIVETKRWF